MTGAVPADIALGRVFCTLTSNGNEDIVWTQDAGDFLGYATGAAPDAQVWDWFADVHRGISCRFSPAAPGSSRNQLSRMRAACSAGTAASTAFDHRVFTWFTATGTLGACVGTA
jgi:hypothetical protein